MVFRQLVITKINSISFSHYDLVNECLNDLMRFVITYVDDLLAMIQSAPPTAYGVARANVYKNARSKYKWVNESTTVRSAELAYIRRRGILLVIIDSSSLRWGTQVFQLMHAAASTAIKQHFLQLSFSDVSGLIY